MRPSNTSLNDTGALPIADYQIDLRKHSTENAAWARGLLDGGPLAVAWVEVMEAEPTPSGRKRPPLAARVHAVEENGKKLLNVLVGLR
ncbi:hypothetical protein [Streptomyces sp. NPDC006668]|uniref:hypothetical protein n=1 Tax=Streptomyces sp. NPDC006668 TaxID=3156903 RepID=UPI00340A7A2D